MPRRAWRIPQSFKIVTLFILFRLFTIFTLVTKLSHFSYFSDFPHFLHLLQPAFVACMRSMQENKFSRELNLVGNSWYQYGCHSCRTGLNYVHLYLCQFSRIPSRTQKCNLVADNHTKFSTMRSTSTTKREPFVLNLVSGHTKVRSTLLQISFMRTN